MCQMTAAPWCIEMWDFAEPLTARPSSLITLASARVRIAGPWSFEIWDFAASAISSPMGSKKTPDFNTL